MSSDSLPSPDPRESAVPSSTHASGPSVPSPQPRPARSPTVAAAGVFGPVARMPGNTFQPGQLLAKCAIAALILAMLGGLLSAGSTLLTMGTLRRIDDFHHAGEQGLDSLRQQRDEALKQRDALEAVPGTPTKSAAPFAAAEANLLGEPDAKFEEAEDRLGAAEKKLKEAESNRSAARQTLLGEWNSTWRRERIAYLLNACLILAAAAAWITWFHRAYGNLAVVEKQPTRWSPAWAAGAWLVPLVNLVVPCWMMAELWRGGKPVAAGRGASHHDARLPMVWLWWALALTWGIAGAGFASSVLLAGNPWNPMEPRFPALWLAVFFNLAALPAGMLSLWIVRGVEAGQEARLLAQRQKRATLA